MKLYCWIALMALAGAVWGQPPGPDILWSQAYNLPGIADIPVEPSFTAQLADHGFIIVGRVPDYPNTDYLLFLIRTDANGDTVWTRVYRDLVGFNFTHGLKSGSQEFVLTGSYSGNVVLFKINTEGDSLFLKQYGRGRGQNICLTADDGFAIVGETSNFGTNTLIVRTNSSGDTLWTRIIDINPYPYPEWGNDIKQTHDGGFIALSELRRRESLFTQDIVLIRLDANGDTLWTRVYTSNVEEHGYSVAETSDGGFIVVGSHRDEDQNILAFRTDSQGNIVRTQIMDFDSSLEALFYLKPSPLGGWIAGGYVDLLRPPWFYAGMLIRFTDNLDTVWTRFYSDIEEYSFSHFDFTADGGLILTGSYEQWHGCLPLLVRTEPDQVSTNPTGLIGIPDYFQLHNYPNPFNAATTLSFSLSHTSPVSLTIFNLLGQAVYRAELGMLNAGLHRQVFDASELPSGVYLARVQAGEQSQMRKMVLLK